MSRLPPEIVRLLIPMWAVAFVAGFVLMTR
jgi:hypothetical protein